MILLQVIVGGLLLGAVYALFSSGLTLIWGMMNVINFAHGEFVMIGMYVAFVVVTYLHGGPLAFSATRTAPSATETSTPAAAMRIPKTVPVAWTSPWSASTMKGRFSRATSKTASPAGSDNRRSVSL